MEIQRLPLRVQIKLNSSDTNYCILTPQVTLKYIQQAQKPKSGVPGDLPRRLVIEFCEELAYPLTTIFNNITFTGEWPAEWKVELGIPLAKVLNPYDESQVRIISLTALYSKIYEKIVLVWLLRYVKTHIDPRQYGGMKGSSITHYLIELVNFILYNQDLPESHAVLVATVEFHKAFNRQSHNILLMLLSDFDVPGWLPKSKMAAKI